MSTTLVISLMVIVAILTGLITWLVSRMQNLRIQSELQNDIKQLETTLDFERQNHKQQAESKKRLEHIFSSLSNEALRNNNDAFLKLAQENLKQFQIKAEANLNTKEKAIEHLVKPIRDALSKTEAQIHEIEKERKQSFGALNQHLESLAKAHDQLQGETRNLVTALRRPEVRGKWGELTLKRVVELAGMVDRCDFFEQQQVDSDNGLIRPDMIVRLPNEREIVVDAKAPLDGYLNAIEASDDSVKAAELERHARNVRERIKELASKAYWSQFEQTPDFVVMFIPGEQFLSAALETDRDLIEFALKQKIIIATPTTLVALLRAVAYGWRQQSLEKNAEKIKQLGQELYSRVAKFTEHLTGMGKSLSKTVELYNKSIGTVERQILPSTRKMEELGIEAEKSPALPNQVETSVRELQAGITSTDTDTDTGPSTEHNIKQETVQGAEHDSENNTVIISDKKSTKGKKNKKGKNKKSKNSDPELST